MYSVGPYGNGADIIVPAGEVLVAVKEAGCPIEGVSGVVDGRTLKWQEKHCRGSHLLPEGPACGQTEGVPTSLGVLWAAQRKIHCSVAVIWVQVSGWHSPFGIARELVANGVQHIPNEPQFEI